MKENRKAGEESVGIFIKTLRIMKLSVFFSFLFIAQAWATSTYSQETRLTLDMKNVRVMDVLDAIEKKSEFFFFFNEKLVNVDRKVDIEVKDGKIEEILSDLFQKTDINYKVIDRQIILTPQKGEMEAVQQTGKKVTGKVTDSAGASLPGVSVVVKGTTTGVITDNNGSYSLQNVQANSTLQFSFVGMKMQEITVAGKSSINVILVEDAIGIEEVVAIGYGTRTKRDLTSSISTINSDNIGKVVSSNANMALQGRMTGVYVGDNSGNPAHSPKVRIRGVNTWGDSDPLYVIDGVPITDPKQEGYSAPLNIMNLIDPNDIESVSVLKDASSAAIYGVRASNGVILITTKKGHSGEKVTAEFSSRFGVQNIVQHLDLLNSEQYIKHVQNVWASDPTVSRDPTDVKYFDPVSPNYLGGSPTYDWQKAVKNINAPTQDYSFRVSGGTEKSDYFLSVSNSSMEGTLIGSNFNRLSANIKLNTQLNSWIKMGVDYRIFSTNHENNQSGENLWRFAELINTPPVQPIYGNGPNGYAPVVGGVQPDGTYNAEKLYGSGTSRNMNALISLNASEDQLVRNLGFIYVEFEPVKQLKVKFQTSMDVNNTKNKNYFDYSSSVFLYDAGDPRSRGGGNSVGSYGEGYNNRSTYVNEVTVNYKKSFGNHNLDVTLNGMLQNYKSEGLSANTDYLSSSVPYLRKIYGERQYTSAISGFDRDKLAGSLGRISYNYKGKYYLDMTTRRDGSAHFQADYRWGIFPSFSTAWRISEEKFFDKSSWISDLKIRGGWGQLGNQNTRSFSYLLPVNTYPSYAWGNDPAKPGIGYYSNAAAVYTIPNKTLAWEKTTTSDIGFDAVILNNLDFSFDYYNKLTAGILQEVTLPLSTGIREQPVDNIASVRNSGIEMSMNYSGKVGKFNYSVGANLSTVKNVVEETYNHIPLWNIEEGQSMFYIKGYKVGGIFQSQAEVDAWKAKYTDVNYQTSKIAPGDMFFLDQRSAPDQPNTFYKNALDNKIDSYDQVYLGKTIPGYYYGFNLSLDYKGIDLNAQFTGVGDVDKINSIRAQFEYTPGTGNNLSTNIFNSWTQENKSKTIPRIIAGDPAQNFRQSNLYLESGAYLRLSNLQIGYTLPSNFYHLIKSAISNVRLYAGASNLFTLTKYSGFDPENDDYPTPRLFFTGLNIRF
jgi:TonB-linked SusC/RagA family outer membrane protein